MNPTLKEFYGNIHMRETVKAFLIEQLKEMAVDRVFDKKAISGIYEARKVVDKAFDKLDEAYGKIEKREISNSR